MNDEQRHRMMIMAAALNEERGIRNQAFRVIRMLAEDAATIARINGDPAIVLEKVTDILAEIDKADATSAEFTV
jgi:hypothetical protein